MAAADDLMTPRRRFAPFSFARAAAVELSAQVSIAFGYCETAGRPRRLSSREFLLANYCTGPKPFFTRDDAFIAFTTSLSRPRRHFGRIYAIPQTRRDVKSH